MRLVKKYFKKTTKATKLIKKKIDRKKPRRMQFKK
jgi:hypothetical protein